MESKDLLYINNIKDWNKLTDLFITLYKIGFRYNIELIAGNGFTWMIRVNKIKQV